jgi:hypothetical protein
MAEVALLLGIVGAWACFLGLVNWVDKIQKKVDALTPLEAQFYTDKDGNPTYIVMNAPVTQAKIEALRVAWEKAWEGRSRGVSKEKPFPSTLYGSEPKPCLNYRHRTMGYCECGWSEERHPPPHCLAKASHGHACGCGRKQRLWVDHG